MGAKKTKRTLEPLTTYDPWTARRFENDRERKSRRIDEAIDRGEERYGYRISRRLASELMRDGVL